VRECALELIEPVHLDLDDLRARPARHRATRSP
jgi:hypothetical protein